MGLRQQKLADEIRDLLAMQFQGGRMADPRLQSVTITAVKVSPDLQIASVYFRVYEDDKVVDAEAGLKSASGFLKKQLASNLDVRRVPELRFFFDKSVEEANNIESLLQKLKDES